MTFFQALGSAEFQRTCTLLKYEYRSPDPDKTEEAQDFE